MDDVVDSSFRGNLIELLAYAGRKGVRVRIVNHFFLSWLAFQSRLILHFTKINSRRLNLRLGRRDGITF
jgi:hypothetical protein